MFDLDGVIFNAEKIMIKAYKEAIGLLNGTNPNDKDIKNIITESPYKVFERFNISGYQGNKLYKKYYINLIDKEATMFNEIDLILRKLRSAGYKMGIVTSQPRKRLDKILNKLLINNLFNITISWNDIPRGKSKPNPAGINIACDKLMLTKSNCCYVGDTVKDIQAARNAGVKSVAVTWGLEEKVRLESSKPDLILYNTSELHDIEKFLLE